MCKNGAITCFSYVGKCKWKITNVEGKIAEKMVGTTISDFWYFWMKMSYFWRWDIAWMERCDELIVAS